MNITKYQDTKPRGSSRNTSNTKQTSIADEKPIEERPRKQLRRRGLFLNTLKQKSESKDPSASRIKTIHTSSMVHLKTQNSEQDKASELKRDHSIRDRYNCKGLYEHFLHTGHKRNQSTNVTNTTIELKRNPNTSRKETQNRSSTLESFKESNKVKKLSHKHTKSFIKLDLAAKIDNVTESINKLSQLRETRDAPRIKPRPLKTRIDPVD